MQVLKSWLTVVSLALAASSATVAQTAAEDKQVFHVTGPRALFDKFYDAHKEHVDLWSTATNADGTIEVQVHTTRALIDLFYASSGDEDPAPEHHARRQLRFLATQANSAEAAAQEKIDIAACHKATVGYLDVVGAQGAGFTTSAFHDCWRTSAQMFEFLDKLAALAPQYLTKIASIGKTFQGVDIPVYKISTGVDAGKQALVGQSLIHAREWQTGSSVVYIIAGLVDGLRAGDARIQAMFAKYDWYFVPVLNIDGYDHTWTDKNRLWRKNRRTFTVNGTAYVGIDLNRNFGPVAFFDLEGDSKRPNTDIYPGTGVLSEPESAAVFGFLQKLPSKLAGLLDVHMNAQAILRPFSNQVVEAPEPYQTKLTNLGDTIRRAIEGGSTLQYRNIMGGTGSYLAYGTFKDAVYMEMDHVPAYTLELERADGGFITPQETIRDVGNRTLAAFVAFSEGVDVYWAATVPSCKESLRLAKDSSIN